MRQIQKRDAILVTNSSIGMMQTCPRRYQYRYEFGWVPAKTHPALITGSLFHFGLEKWYSMSQCKEEIVLEDVERQVDMIKAMMKTEIDKSDIEQQECLSLARFLVEQYIFHYLEDKEWDVLDIEPVFEKEIEFPEVSVVFTGKSDLVIGEKQNGSMWIVEHKTAQSIDADYMGKLPLDRQVLAYLFGMRLSGAELNGVVYNVVGKPHTYRRKGESIEGYLSRVIIDYQTSPSSYFVRQRCYRDGQDEGNLVEQIHDMSLRLIRYRELNCFPQHTDQCFIRGRVCPYTDLCIRGISSPAIMAFKQEVPHIELMPSAERGTRQEKNDKNAN